MPLGAHESVHPAKDERDYGMLHHNRLISSLPHSVPFRSDPFSVSCFSFTGKYFGRKRLFLALFVKQHHGHLWVFFYACPLYTPKHFVYFRVMCIKAEGETGCEMWIYVSIFRQVFRG